MSSLIIDYRIRGSEVHVYSQFIIFKSIDYRIWRPSYKLIEIFSYNRVPVRKKLSLKTIKKIINGKSRRFNDYIRISQYTIYYKDEFFKEATYSYIKEEDFVVLKDWISKEMMN